MKKKYYIHPTVIFETIDVDDNMHQLSKTMIEGASQNGGTTATVENQLSLGGDDDPFAAKQTEADFNFDFELDM